MAKSNESSFENDDTTGGSAGIVNRSDVRATKWLGGSGGVNANVGKPGYINFLRENVNLHQIAGLPGAEQIEREIELSQREQIDNWDASTMRDALDEILLPTMEEMGRSLKDIEKDLKKETGLVGKDAELTQEEEEMFAAASRREVRK